MTEEKKPTKDEPTELLTQGYAVDRSAQPGRPAGRFRRRCCCSPKRTSLRGAERPRDLSLWGPSPWGVQGRAERKNLAVPTDGVVGGGPRRCPCSAIPIAWLAAPAMRRLMTEAV